MLQSLNPYSQLVRYDAPPEILEYASKSYLVCNLLFITEIALSMTAVTLNPQPSTLKPRIDLGNRQPATLHSQSRRRPQ